MKRGPEKDENDVVPLLTAPNPAQAHIWEQALKEEGIPCRVVGDYLEAGLGDIPGLSAEIWVHRDDLKRAREVLERSRKEAALPEEDED